MAAKKRSKVATVTVDDVFMLKSRLEDRSKSLLEEFIYLTANVSQYFRAEETGDEAEMRLQKENILFRLKDIKDRADDSKK
jgi:hypothetical protein